MVILTISHDFMKLWSFVWLNCVSMKMTPYMLISAYNMLIVAYM